VLRIVRSRRRYLLIERGRGGQLVQHVKRGFEKRRLERCREVGGRGVGGRTGRQAPHAGRFALSWRKRASSSKSFIEGGGGKKERKAVKTGMRTLF
jgi:hypothetical protein